MQLKLATLLLLWLGAAAPRDHYLPHTHLDYGWLKTVKDYYGQKVKPIHDSLLKALEKPTNQVKKRLRRKFVLNDLAFLRMWLDEDPGTRDAKIARLRKLIEGGQLEVVGNSMVMADTASAHYEEVMNTFFAGIGFTEQVLGTRSQVAWQLDPFGHSHSFYYVASLFGVQDVVLARLHEGLKERLGRVQQLQFLWRLPLDRSVVAHVMPEYNWERSLSCTDDCSTFQSWENHFGYFAENRRAVYNQTSLVPLGDDFSYEFADEQFRVFEEKVDVPDDFEYSTVEEYLADFYQDPPRLTAFVGDLFPYADSPEFDFSHQNYQPWTGYFTTKPNLKMKIRQVHKLHRAVQNWVILTVFKREILKEMGPALAELVEVGRDVGTLLHHDTITGTSTRRVDVETFDRIADMERRLLGTLDLVSGSESAICDFHDFAIGTADCRTVWELARNPLPVQIKVFNPTLRPISRRIRMAVPLDFARNFISVLMTLEEQKPVVAVEYRKWNLVFLEFEADLPVSALPVRFGLLVQDDQPLFREWDEQVLGNLRQGITTYRLKQAGLQVPSEFQAVRARPTPIGKFAEKRFKNWVVRVYPRSIRVRTFNPPSSVTISLVRRKSRDSNAYVQVFDKSIGAKTFGVFKKVQFFESTLDNWGVVVHGSRADFIVRSPAGKAHFEVQLLMDWHREINYFSQVALRVERADFRDARPEFWTESNGLFEIRRKNTDEDQKNIYPIVSKASLRAPGLAQGMSVWVDRARGASSDGSAILIAVQRSGVDGKGQNEYLQDYDRTCARFYVLNFRDETQEAEEKKIRDDLDLETPVIFDKGAPWDGYTFEYDSVGSWYDKDEVQVGPNLRFWVDSAEPTRFVVKFQNVGRNAPETLHAKKLLRYWFGGREVWEVGFEMVSNEGVTDLKPAQNSYTLGPLEFKTFLIQVN